MNATHTDSTVVMPRLSDAMEEGTIVAWLIDDGAAVTAGDDLVEIETDKATAVYQAPASGILTRLAAEGETVPVGARIADLGGGSPADTAGDSAPSETASRSAGREPSQPSTAASARSSSSPAANGRGRRPVSPLARRLAAEAGVDLSSLTGSGARGRISRRDVEAYLERSGERTAPTPPVDGSASGLAAGAAEPRGERVALTRGQSIVARRMAEAKSTIPDFQTTVEVDMEECVALRQSLKELAVKEAAASYNDMVIRACALALRQHPRVNSSYRGDSVEIHGAVNIGMAVAAGGRLLVPTVRDADRHDLRRIAAETRRLAAKVREQTITPAELSGATFTVSNLGMLGVDQFIAVINPGQVAILAVGTVAPRAVVRDGRLTARTTMHVTLSADHRVVYGADAAHFLSSVRHLLEHPIGLLLQAERAP